MKRESLIEQFSQYSHLSHEYDCTGRLVHDKTYNPKLSVSYGKKISKAAQKLIDTDLDSFIELLFSDDIIVAEMAAEYLYPIYPKKCLELLEKYKKTLTCNIAKFTVQTKIDGLKEQQTFFVDMYKDLFHCTDIEQLKQLNREKPDR